MQSYLDHHVMLKLRVEKHLLQTETIELNPKPIGLFIEKLVSA